MLLFYLFDCPIPKGQSLTHELDSDNICRNCGFPQDAADTDLRKQQFYDKYRDLYRQQSNAKKAQEKKQLLANIGTIPVSFPEFGNADEDYVAKLGKEIVKFSELKQKEFLYYGTAATFGAEFNKSKVLALYSSLFVMNASAMTREELETKR